MGQETVIDPLARVAPGARLGIGVKIGPFSIVEADAEIGDGTELISHACVKTGATIGAGCILHPFAVIGGPPQDLSYKGEATTVVVGDRCTFRESVTVNRGSPKQKGVTRIGSHCFMMALSHVAHDCTVGDNVIFANGATLGGHCEVGSFVFLGGLCGVHQFTRIGDFAMVGGVTGVKEDIVPYGMAFGANGSSGELIGLNVIGMRRRGLGREDIRTAKACFDALFFGPKTFQERFDAAALAYRDHPVAGRLIAFIEAGDKRPLMMAAPRRTRVAGADD